MSDDDAITREAPTRREYLTYGGSVIGGGLLAGCAGDTAGSDPTPTASGTATPTTDTGTETPTGTTTRGDTGYSVTMSPMGTVEFDADVHHIDPLRAVDSLDGLDEGNVGTVTGTVGPFFANRGSRANNVPGGVQTDYRFYSLWEILSKFAEVYQVRDRSAALKSVRDGMVAHIQSNLPPEDERPTVALAGFWQGEFYVYDPNKPGFGSAHTRPVQLVDALPDVEGYAASNWQTSPISVEAMLEADPDVYISHNAVGSPEYYQDTALPEMRDDPVASQLSAVQNDRVYPGGLGLQGPLFDLFQIEMTAKQVSPDLFGEYPGLREPVPEEEQLFDRQRVRDIVDGDTRR